MASVNKMFQVVTIPNLTANIFFVYNLTED